MHAPSIWALLVVAVVVVLLFGRGKISGTMGEVAEGIKAFRKGMRDELSPQIDTAAAPVEMKQTDAQPRKDA